MSWREARKGLGVREVYKLELKSSQIIECRKSYSIMLAEQAIIDDLTRPRQALGEMPEVRVVFLWVLRVVGAELLEGFELLCLDIVD